MARNAPTDFAQNDIIVPAAPTAELPTVRKITVADIRDVLWSGLADFRAMPTHVIFLSLIYPVVGLLLGRAAFGMELIPILYPLATGFALIGPFAAIGLYELSRRRELGLDTSWKHAFDIVHSPSFPSILGLGLLLLAIFSIWIGVAHALYIASFGYAEPASLDEFSHNILRTSEGQTLIVVGNVVGFLFAVVAFTLSVISFPLLLDRNVGIATAVITSIKAISLNPQVMALWGLVVVGGLIAGSLPLLVGLAVVMPILGHATWHLYRKLVEPDNRPRPEYNPRPKGKRYAAEFPASLFASSSDPSDDAR